MPDGLYDRDFLLWSEAQAGLLRRLAAGERVNAAIDWPNLIEEVGDLGQSELNACSSHLRQALIHLLKLAAWPKSRSAGHWRGEVIALLADAAQEFSPSMQQRIDLTKLYNQASMVARSATDDPGDAQVFPNTCPYILGQLFENDVSLLWVNAKG